ncbi:MAG: PhoH family protein [Alphaproteobacteria bacterium]|nr:PhoH family protein [Alphaproteobacteria bacterium]
MARRPAKKAAARAKRKEQKQEKQVQNIYKPVEIELRTEMQKRAWDSMDKNLITFLLGSAGSGKTFLATAYAINAVLSKQCDKIVLTRPIVESGEKLGFLPGTFGEKVNPYMQPLYDTLEVMVGRGGAQRELINKSIVLAPLCYMRGRTFNDSICIFDEAQNASYQQLKLFLSRFGKNTKYVITGDPQQSDLYSKDVPLTEVVQRLRSVTAINAIKFSNADVVRHPLVAEILKKL